MANVLFFWKSLRCLSCLYDQPLFQYELTSSSKVAKFEMYLDQSFRSLLSYKGCSDAELVFLEEILELKEIKPYECPVVSAPKS